MKKLEKKVHFVAEGESVGCFVGPGFGEADRQVQDAKEGRQ